MKIGKFLVCAAAAFFIAACLSVAAFAQESGSIAVLGFVNLGNKSDASVNKTITRSLITFLSKIQEINITSYEAVEKSAAGNKYWESKSFSPDAAIDMGLSLAAGEVVSGDYSVDHKKDTVTIDVYVYDTALGTMKLQRQYAGEAGPGLFDTVDKMIRNVSTLITGRTIKMGRLQLEIEGTDSYKLSINGKFMKKISKSDGYNDSEIAEEPMDITLSVPATEEVIYRTNVSIGDGLAVDITYNPNPQAVSGAEEKEPASEHTGKMKIAVLDFDSESGIDKKDLLTLAETLRAELAKTGTFEVMQKKQQSKLLSGIKLETSDLTSEGNSASRKKLGKELKAKLAVTGTIDSAFKNISMNIHLLDLETGEILLTETPSCSEDGVFKEMHEIALDINGKITGSEMENKGNNKEDNRIAAGNLCPDGDFQAEKIRMIAGGYNNYLRNLAEEWHLIIGGDTYGGAGAPSSVVFAKIENSEAHITIKVRKNFDQGGVQLCMMPIILEQYKQYRVTFNARADRDKKIGASLIQIGRWIVYGGDQFEINNELKTYSFTFRMEKDTAETSRLDFDLNSTEGECWISKVRIEEVKEK